MKIVADVHIPCIKEYFNSYGELVLLPGRAITPADVQDADILIVRSVTHVNEELLSGSKVKYVGSVTAGGDHLDTNWLDEAGILWDVAAGFNAPPVADYVVSTIAALQQQQLLGKENLTAAVIGVGNVGRIVTEKLKLLNFDVVLCDPPRAEHEKDFISTKLDDLTNFDLISLHVPLTRANYYPTYHFIERHFLQRQKPECVLLNASRGAVINSDDLLRYGTHLHWCFDVWEHEPKINKAILAQTKIATPHIAGYSAQSKIRGIDMIYQLACKKNIIHEQVFTPIVMPHQYLEFNRTKTAWQDIVLGVFNPLVITEMMQTILMPASDYGHLFDEMRHQFNYRHEYAYTNLVDLQTQTTDIVMVEKLGIQIVKA